MLARLFQKAKWDIMAYHKPWYYIWSRYEEHDEGRYRESGHADIGRLIQKDSSVAAHLDSQTTIALEIGCGNGRLSEFFAPLVKELYVLDISPKMIDLARTRLKDFHNVHFLVGGGDTYALPDAAIDVVFSYIVFQHFATRQMVERNLQEVLRVLKKGGIAKIQLRETPIRGGWRAYTKWYYGVSLPLGEIESILKKGGASNILVKENADKEFWAQFSK